MKATHLKFTLSASLLALAGCGNGSPTDQLQLGNQISSYAGSVSTPGNTQQHHAQVSTGKDGVIGKAPVTDPTVVEQQTVAVGSIEVEARLHSCTKITYAALGQLMTSRGVVMTDSTKGSAGYIYQTGIDALGLADYPARTAEMLIPTAATESKQMDIFVAASTAIPTTTPFASTTGCSGVSLLDTTGAFTSDGISCLIGKPATAAHLTIANQILAEAPDPTTGVQLAISTLLEAAHTCE
jgi:hypothetical protein